MIMKMERGLGWVLEADHGVERDFQKGERSFDKSEIHDILQYLIYILFLISQDRNEIRG